MGGVPVPRLGSENSALCVDGGLGRREIADRPWPINGPFSISNCSYWRLDLAHF